MKTEVIEITPELAKKMLLKNKGNRIVSDRHVNFISQQMLAGKWRFAADPIRFSKSGKLIDGQHRLLAVVKSNTAYDFLVIHGLDDDVFNMIDTGKNRNASDLLSIQGISAAGKVASAARFIILFEAGRYNAITNGKTVLATNDDIVRFINNTPEILEICSYTSTIYRKFGFIPCSALSSLYYLMSRKNQTKTDMFFESYGNGLNLEKDSPILVLRERLIRDSIAKRRMPLKERIALFVIAWNHFIAKKNIQRLVWVNQDDFPKIN